MKRDSPIPIGARNVALCFSAASMKIVKISSAVRSISMNSPRVIDVPSLRVVRTASGPGNKADTMPAAEIAPSTWENTRRPALSQLMAPTKASAIET